MGYRVAVVGATGAVGREMLNLLEELAFPVDRLHAIASRRRSGVEVGWRDGVVACEDIARFDFSRVDLVLVSAGSKLSRDWADRIGAAGPIVIDNSSAWRMDEDVPLIVPEVNPEDAPLARRKNIVANPNCSTAQLVVALKPLHDAVPIRRAVVSTYQSVSGAGERGHGRVVDPDQGASSCSGPSEPKLFPKQIAFNVIPFIGELRDDGYTDEEAKMWSETHKILDPVDRPHRHLRPRAGDGRPRPGRPPGVRRAVGRGRGARDPARGAGDPRHRSARRDRLHDAEGSAGRVRRLRLAHPTRSNASTTAWRCGSSPTTCARARR